MGTEKQIKCILTTVYTNERMLYYGFRTILCGDYLRKHICDKHTKNKSKEEKTCTQSKEKYKNSSLMWKYTFLSRFN